MDPLMRQYSVTGYGPRELRAPEGQLFPAGIRTRGDSEASIWASSSRCTAVSTNSHQNSHQTILASPPGEANLI
jgi:hypothetical protein